MKKRLYSIKHYLFNFFLATVGSVLYAASICLFLDPNSLAPGGVSGIAILVNTGIDIGTGLWILILNIPLIIIGAIKFKWKFLVSTLYATVLSSVLMDVGASYLKPITTEPMLAAIAGGALLAVGMGLVLRSGATTAGFDIVVKLLRRKYKHVKSGVLYFSLDTVIIVASAIVYNNIETALYATIGLLVSSMLLDIVLYGSDSAKLVYIVCNKPHEIADRITHELPAGATFLEGEGVYTDTHRDVIMTVVHKQLYPKLRELIKSEDPGAFIIVTNATEIFGKGFKNPYQDEV